MVILYSNADSDIDSGSPDTNYGTLSGMTVRTSINEARALVNFDLSGEVNTLSKASLFLNVHVAGNTTLTIQRITSTWTETGVTWNNQPTKTSTNQATFGTGTVADTWLEIDVTNIIIDCIDNTNYGMMIFDAGDVGNSDNFWTRESAYDPYIVISYDKYVDISTGSDSDSGNTWALAYLTVKKGIDNISIDAVLHIAEGDYSAQAAIDLNKNLELLCEDYGGGNASPPLTVILPVTT